MKSGNIKHDRTNISWGPLAAVTGRQGAGCGSLACSLSATHCSRLHRSRRWSRITEGFPFLLIGAVSAWLFTDTVSKLPKPNPSFPDAILHRWRRGLTSIPSRNIHRLGFENTVWKIAIRLYWNDNYFTALSGCPCYLVSLFSFLLNRLIIKFWKKSFFLFFILTIKLLLILLFCKNM